MCNWVTKCTQHVAPNNIAICCVKVLRFFDQCFIFGLFRRLYYQYSCTKVALCFFQSPYLCRHRVKAQRHKIPWHTKCSGKEKSEVAMMNARDES